MVISKIAQNIRKFLGKLKFPPWFWVEFKVIPRFYTTKGSFYGAVRAIQLKTRDTMFKRVSPMSHFERNYKISLKESIGFLNKCLENHENS